MISLWRSFSSFASRRFLATSPASSSPSPSDTSSTTCSKSSSSTSASSTSSSSSPFFFWTAKPKSSRPTMPSSSSSSSASPSTKPPPFLCRRFCFAISSFSFLSIACHAEFLGFFGPDSSVEMLNSDSSVSSAASFDSVTNFVTAATPDSAVSSVSLDAVGVTTVFPDSDTAIVSGLDALSWPSAVGFPRASISRSSSSSLLFDPSAIELPSGWSAPLNCKTVVIFCSTLPSPSARSTVASSLLVASSN
mmetsp:Transcript_15255/g.25123  ORF Transcript_15255/g.25123 Transcript_15255/m.25123 type:complete len:249 (+) Transcript_15255:4054-4800(+)